MYHYMRNGDFFMQKRNTSNSTDIKLDLADFNRPSTQRRPQNQVRTSPTRPRQPQPRQLQPRQPQPRQPQGYKSPIYEMPRRVQPKPTNQRPINRKRKKRKSYSRQILTILLCVMLALLFLHGLISKKKAAQETIAPVGSNNVEQGVAGRTGDYPTWKTDYLTVNDYSRPGTPLNEVKSIFVHYTANPGTSGKQNRSYFENLKDNHETSASAHFIIGYEGEIINCIPLNEMAYAVQTRNEDSISIECCYLEKDGSFTEPTYESLIKLLRWLIDTYNLTEEDILRHYDCGGKKCPLYYADNADEWEKLKQDVKAAAKST